MHLQQTYEHSCCWNRTSWVFIYSQSCGKTCLFNVWDLEARLYLRSNENIAEDEFLLLLTIDATSALKALDTACHIQVLADSMFFKDRTNVIDIYRRYACFSNQAIWNATGVILWITSNDVNCNVLKQIENINQLFSSCVIIELILCESQIIKRNISLQLFVGNSNELITEL